MNFGYIKLDKPKKGIFNNILYKLRYFFNLPYKDRYIKENYYIPNTTDKSKKRLLKLLNINNIDYILTENNLDINYKTLDGTHIVKYMLPELVKYCFTLIHPKVEEIFVCTNVFNNENVTIIKDLTYCVKVVNIVSNNNRYLSLEKELENKGIYITVNNNKRKSLKKSNIVINLDFNDLKNYSINRSMIIIDVSNRLKIDKGFDGIYVKGIKLGTDKVMRVFSEYENFKKSELIEAEILKIEKYNDIRKYIEMNKFEIKQVIGERLIALEEFKRVEKAIS